MGKHNNLEAQAQLSERHCLINMDSETLCVRLTTSNTFLTRYLVLNKGSSYIAQYLVLRTAQSAFTLLP